MHGCSECAPGAVTCNHPFNMIEHGEIIQSRSVQYAIGELGYKLGIIGGSDAHIYPLGSLMPDPYHYEIAPPYHCYGTALTAVYAPGLTREDIFEGIKNRHTYATSGERILLEFEMDGHPMGSEYATSRCPSIEVTVGGTNTVKKVEVVKYSDSRGWEIIHVERPSTLTCTFTYTDTSFAEDSLYYVRVIQVDNEMAWSSPIWVNKVEGSD